MHRSASLVLVALALAACDGTSSNADAGPSDAGASLDTGVDAARPDAGPRDAGSDAGPPWACDGADCAIVELALAGRTTCVRRENGTVLCWGRGQEGELGDGAMRHGGSCPVPGEAFPDDCSARPVIVALDAPAEALVPAFSSICAVTGGSARTHLCWGQQGYQIGTTLPTIRLAPEEVTTFAGVTLEDGQSHACWLDASGNPFCIGRNSRGQLGDGTRMDRTDPVAPTSYGMPAALGDLDLLELEVSVFSGSSCVRTASEMLCWGTNDSGQLGDDDPMHDDCGGGTTYSDCSLRATPVTLDASLVTDIVSGDDHHCVLLTDGTVSCWGNNQLGQLGLGDTTFRALPTPVPGLSDVVELESSGATVCARRSDGTVWCWGRSDVGRVGDGEMLHDASCTPGSTIIDCQPTPVQVMGLTDATDVEIGFGHLCALRADGSVSCWGNNDRYQLGDGTRETRYAPVAVVGLP